MKIFIDSADIDEIKIVDDYGILDGVTTNPSLIKKAVDLRKKKGKVDISSYIKKILKIMGKRAVSLEVLGDNYKEMIGEGELLYKKFKKYGNVNIKIPVNPCFSLVCTHEMEGIKAIRYLSKKKIPVNTTLIFTPEQALLAAKAGASFVSPFAGRVDDMLRADAGIKFDKKEYYPAGGKIKGKRILNDNGIDSGVDLIEKIRVIFDRDRIKCKILAASIRNIRQFREVALAGADIATVPLNVINSLVEHKKTAEGMKGFTKDIVPEYAKLVGYKK